jgi:hypothetical protein
MDTKLEDQIYNILYANSRVDIVRVIYEDEWPVESLLQLIKGVCEEVIGSDLPTDTDITTGQRIHNAVKAEQRQRLSELLGEEGK